MILDLNPLPYRTALNIIRWCWEHNVEKEKCVKLIEAMSKTGYNTEDIEWVLDIPDKYLSWFVLKWGFTVGEHNDETV